MWAARDVTTLQGSDLLSSRIRRTGPPGAAPARPAGPRTFWGVWSVGLVLSLLFALQAASNGEVGEVPDVWLVSTVAFVWLTLSWRGPGLLPRPQWPVFLLTLAALAAVGVTIGLLLGASPWDTVRAAVGIPAQAVTMAALTRLARKGLRIDPHPSVPGASAWRDEWARSWAPSGAREFFALAVGALGSGAVSLLLGSFPGLNFWVLEGFEPLRWMSHVMVVCVVGGATGLIIFSAWSPPDADHPWVRIVGLWLCSATILLWVHATGTVSMAWLQVIPTLFIALTCRVWVTATFSLLLGAVSVTLSPRLNAMEVTYGEVPMGAAMDLLVAALIMVALTLGFLEQRRNDLVRDLEVERRRTAKHLEVMHTVFESMREGVVVVSSELDLQFHNAAAVELLGRPFPNERGGDWTSHFDLTSLDGRRLRDADLEHVEHLVLTTPEGRRVLHQQTLRSGDGLMAVLADVTEQHARMDELSGFAGVVAHDLRSPLTSLEGWLEMAVDALAHGEVEEARVMLGRARSGNRRMRQIIDDWLTYTVERQGELEVSDFALAEPVDAVVSQLAEGGPHRFSIEVPHHVRGDQATIRQVLANLLGNSSKFSRPHETPQIAVRSHRVDDDWIRVDVEDRGIGLPPGAEEAVFEEFRRGSGAASQVEGFGLGLALCRRVVERHGGTIWARNNAHGGATFSFTLPRAGDPGQTSGPTPQLVDDLHTFSRASREPGLASQPRG